MNLQENNEENDANDDLLTLNLTPKRRIHMSNYYNDIFHIFDQECHSADTEQYELVQEIKNLRTITKGNNTELNSVEVKKNHDAIAEASKRLGQVNLMATNLLIDRNDAVLERRIYYLYAYLGYRQFFGLIELCGGYETANYPKALEFVKQIILNWVPMEKSFTLEELIKMLLKNETLYLEKDFKTHLYREEMLHGFLDDECQELLEERFQGDWILIDEICLEAFRMQIPTA